VTAPVTLSDAVVGTTLAPTTYRWSETDVISTRWGSGRVRPRTTTSRRARRPRRSSHLRADCQLVGREGSARGARPRIISDRAFRAVLRLERPLGATGEVSVTAEVTAIWDKGKHAAIEVASVGVDDAGPLFSAPRRRWSSAGVASAERVAGCREDPKGAPTRYTRMKFAPSRPPSTGSAVTVIRCTSTRCCTQVRLR
jgi:hypothetical protein